MGLRSMGIRKPSDVGLGLWSFSGFLEELCCLLEIVVFPACRIPQNRVKGGLEGCFWCRLGVGKTVGPQTEVTATTAHATPPPTPPPPQGRFAENRAGAYISPENGR